jgi:hypothetical protein
MYRKVQQPRKHRTEQPRRRGGRQETWRRTQVGLGLCHFLSNSLLCNRWLERLVCPRGGPTQLNFAPDSGHRLPFVLINFLSPTADPSLRTINVFFVCMTRQVLLSADVQYVTNNPFKQFLFYYFCNSISDFACGASSQN